MKYDYKKVYEKNADFLTAHPKIKGAVVLFNAVVPYLFLAAYALLWAYGMFGKTLTPKDLAKIFFVPASTLFAVTLLRLGIDRARPYSERGAGITPLKVKKSDGTSFPSRHLACATVLAFTFFPYFLSVGAALTLLALGLGYCRFALGWHYPGDLFAGFAVGAILGCLIFII